jgi:hypothetical protein
MDPLTFADDVEQRKRMLPLALSFGNTLTNTVQPGQALPMTMRSRLQKVSQDLDALDAKEPDLSEWQAYARQRGQEGQSSMLNALAAQYAGENFQPLQAQLLKRAAASQEPMKLGNALMTSDGQIIKDPYAARDIRRATLERQMGGLLAGIEREDARQERLDESRRQFDAGQNTKRELAQNSNDLRREIAENRPVDNTKNYRLEDNMRNQFEHLTKPYREEIDATAKVTQMVNAVPVNKQLDTQQQAAIIILLNKFLDPGSVVREGEFDRVVKQQGLLGRAQVLKDRITKGGFLTPETVGQINQLAKFYSDVANNKMRQVAGQYADVARKRSLDVGSVITNPSYLGDTGGNLVDFNKLPK